MRIRALDDVGDAGGGDRRDVDGVRRRAAENVEARHAAALTQVREVELGDRQRLVAMRDETGEGLGGASDLEFGQVRVLREAVSAVVQRADDVAVELDEVVARIERLLADLDCRDGGLLRRRRVEDDERAAQVENAGPVVRVGDRLNRGSAERDRAGRLVELRDIERPLSVGDRADDAAGLRAGRIRPARLAARLFRVGIIRAGRVAAVGLAGVGVRAGVILAGVGAGVCIFGGGVAVDGVEGGVVRVRDGDGRAGLVGRARACLAPVPLDEHLLQVGVGRQARENRRRARVAADRREARPAADGIEEDVARLLVHRRALDVQHERRRGQAVAVVEVRVLRRVLPGVADLRRRADETGGRDGDERLAGDLGARGGPEHAVRAGDLHFADVRVRRVVRVVRGGRGGRVDGLHRLQPRCVGERHRHRRPACGRGERRGPGLRAVARDHRQQAVRHARPDDVLAERMHARLRPLVRVERRDARQVVEALDAARGERHHVGGADRGEEPVGVVAARDLRPDDRHVRAELVVERVDHRREVLPGKLHVELNHEPRIEVLRRVALALVEQDAADVHPDERQDVRVDEAAIHTAREDLDGHSAPRDVDDADGDGRVLRAHPLGGELREVAEVLVVGRRAVGRHRRAGAKPRVRDVPERQVAPRVVGVPDVVGLDEADVAVLHECRQVGRPVSPGEVPVRAAAGVVFLVVRLHVRLAGDEHKVAGIDLADRLHHAAAGRDGQLVGGERGRERGDFRPERAVRVRDGRRAVRADGDGHGRAGGRGAHHRERLAALEHHSLRVVVAERHIRRERRTSQKRRAQAENARDKAACTIPGI